MFVNFGDFRDEIDLLLTDAIDIYRDKLLLEVEQIFRLKSAEDITDDFVKFDLCFFIEIYAWPNLLLFLLTQRFGDNHKF